MPVPFSRQDYFNLETSDDESAIDCLLTSDEKEIQLQPNFEANSDNTDIDKDKSDYEGNDLITEEKNEINNRDYERLKVASRVVANMGSFIKRGTAARIADDLATIDVWIGDFHGRSSFDSPCIKITSSLPLRNVLIDESEPCRIFDLIYAIATKKTEVKARVNMDLFKRTVKDFVAYLLESRKQYLTFGGDNKYTKVEKIEEKFEEKIEEKTEEKTAIKHKIKESEDKDVDEINMDGLLDNSLLKLINTDSENCDCDSCIPRWSQPFQRTLPFGSWHPLVVVMSSMKKSILH